MTYILSFLAGRYRMFVRMCLVLRWLVLSLVSLPTFIIPLMFIAVGSDLVVVLLRRFLLLL